MGTPLRYDQVLPNGMRLRYGMKAARYGGTVEEVMAALNQEQAMNENYHLNQQITDETLASYLTKQDEAQNLIPFLKTITAPEGKLFTIGVERSGMIPAFETEIAAHPEFMPSDIPVADAAAKISLFTKLKRMKDRRDDENKRLDLALQMAGADLGFIFSGYYGNSQLAAKRNLPDAATTVSNLKPYMAPAKAKTTPTPPTPPA